MTCFGLFLKARFLLKMSMINHIEKDTTVCNIEFLLD